MERRSVARPAKSDISSAAVRYTRHCRSFCPAI